DFPAFKTLCLQTRVMLPPAHYPCPYYQGLARDVLPQQDGSFIGLCRCDPNECQTASLTLADLTPLEVNWDKLGRALCKAFALDRKKAGLGITNTIQFVSWSTDA